LTDKLEIEESDRAGSHIEGKTMAVMGNPKQLLGNPKQLLDCFPT